MKYKLIIVRYGEIALKGKETRRFFEKILIQNIKKSFDKEGLMLKIQKEWGRIFIFTNEINQAKKILKKIFGIYSFSPAIDTKSDLDLISKNSISLLKQVLSDSKTFAVRATRTGKHDYSSQDVAIKIGSDILKNFELKVDLDNPDIELFIEIRNDKAYLFTEKILGIGGLPIGTQGKVLVFVNDKKSVLAAWYLMRRGCNPYFLINKKENKKIINDFLDNWYQSHKLSILNDSDVYNQINHYSKKYNCDAVVTGDSLYENNIEKLSKMKEKILLPIFHPLIILSSSQIKEKFDKIVVNK